MNQDQIEGNLKQLKGDLKQRWGLFVGDPLAVSAGRLECRAGRMQSAYGAHKYAADKQLAIWQKMQR